MARYNDLPVFHEVYRLILLLFQYTGVFSREYKYSVGQDVKRDGRVLVRTIYRANKCVDTQEHLEAFPDDFEVIGAKLGVIGAMPLPAWDAGQPGYWVITTPIGKPTPQQPVSLPHLID